MTTMLRLAIAQFAPAKGEYQANLDRLGEMFAQLDALEPRPHVLHLPETAPTGYFLEGGVRELAVTAGAMARDLNARYRAVVRSARTLDVVIGFYEVWESTLYNSVMYVTLGSEEPHIWHVHRKIFLPTYGLFDEERFVERGLECRAFDTPWGRAGLLVCEDAWHSLTGTLLALDGAEVVFVSSAAPARGIWPRADAPAGPASVARWDRLIRDIAEEHGVFASFANLASHEGGKMFPGGALLIGPKGDVRVRGPLWEEAILTSTIDLADLVRARADSPLLADLRSAMPHLRRTLDAVGREEPYISTWDAVEERVAPSEGAPLTMTHSHTAGGKAGAAFRVICDSGTDNDGPPPLEVDGSLLEAWLVHFIRGEVRSRGFTRAIVALSGGVDSAVTTYLAARALGAGNVVAVRMPYRTSSPESLAHAQLVIDALGVDARTLDISTGVDAYLTNEPEASPSRRGNVMARMRMIALFDLSERYRAIPLGTGNKTERLFGYFTWHADDSPPVNPLGDLYKTQVWALARHLGVPGVIIDKPASADLVTGQTDEGDFGISYAAADRTLNWLLSGYSPADLVARGFDPAEVELVRKRLEGTHWKRKLPTVAMVSPTAIGESYLRPVDY
jgi:NAD+ synthase (glutamine-hydrolysing)